MDRRAFVVALAGGLLGGRATARAQAPRKIWRIGLLAPGVPPGCGRDAPPPALDALRGGLREHGYVEGQTYVFVVRCAVREGSEMASAAKELIGQDVDVVIVASNELVQALRIATSTVPAVFIAVDEPQENGFVASLARPGGNLTGFSHLTGELDGKRLQLLKDTRPRLRKVAVLAAQRDRSIEREAARLGLEVQLYLARQPDEIGTVFASMRGARPEALLVHPHPTFWLERARIVALAADAGLPAIYENADFVTAGGLMAYGASLADMSRRAAGYVDRILKGASPATLPVEQPTTFELVVNLRTAKALGLTLPRSLLLRADRVIE